MFVAKFSDYVGAVVLLWLVAMFFAIVSSWFRTKAKTRGKVTQEIQSASEQQVVSEDRIALDRQIASERLALVLKHQAAMIDFGMKKQVGDELRMGWYEHIFSLEPPIAGIAEFWTLHGNAQFTKAMHCVLMSDGQRLIILDREKNHGVRLEIQTPQWFDADVDGDTIIVSCYKGHGAAEFIQRYVIHTQSDHNSDLVPNGWIGSFTLLPDNSELSETIGADA